MVVQVCEKVADFSHTTTSKRWHVTVVTCHPSLWPIPFVCCSVTITSTHLSPLRPIPLTCGMRRQVHFCFLSFLLNTNFIAISIQRCARMRKRYHAWAFIEQDDDQVKVRLQSPVGRVHHLLKKCNHAQRVIQFPVDRVHRLLKKGNYAQRVIQTIQFPVGRVHRLLKKGNYAQRVIQTIQFPVGRVHHLLKKGNYAQHVGAGAPGQ